LVSLRRWVVDVCPDALFPTLYNTRCALSGRDARINHRAGHGWYIQKDGLTLLSPTPKFIGFGLGVFERKFERYFKIQRGDIVVDVGACIGDTTIPMFMKTGESGKVFAVEPHPLNAKYLRLNVSSFKNVTVIEKAVLDKKGEVVFYTHKAPTGHSLVSGYQRIGCMTVEADTMDNLFRGVDVDFCKIDVQGSEIELLKGSPMFLRRVKHLAVETHGTAWVKGVGEILEAYKNTHNIIFDASTRVYYMSRRS